MLWSTLIFGGIGTPLVTQQLTWWFKVHLSRKAHVSRAMLISKLECWWTKFNVELSLIKLKSKVLTTALRTTKLNCKVECWSFASQMLHSQVECCDLLWFLAGMELHKYFLRDQRKDDLYTLFYLMRGLSGIRRGPCSLFHRSSPSPARFLKNRTKPRRADHNDIIQVMQERIICFHTFIL